MHQTPPLYMAIHVISGALAYFFQPLVLLFVLYQLAQLAFNFRFFFFTMEIKSGNSILYTLYKLAQFFLGYGFSAAVA